MNDDLALLTGVGDRGLRFEIELFLPAAREFAAQTMGDAAASCSSISPRAIFRSGPMNF